MLFYLQNVFSKRYIQAAMIEATTGDKAGASMYDRDECEKWIVTFDFPDEWILVEAKLTI